MAGGGGVGVVGCVCADAAGNIALVTDIAVTNAVTLNECFIWPPFRLITPRPLLITMTLCAVVGSFV